MSENKDKNFGKQIGETVRAALETGDLTRLKDLGPAVQGVVKTVTDSVNQAVGSSAAKPSGTGKTQPPPNYVPPNYMPPGYQNNNGYYRPYQQQAARPQVNALTPYRKAPGAFMGVARIVFGSMGIGISAIALLATGGAILAGAAFASNALLLAGIAGAGFLSGLLIASGRSKRSFAKRMSLYYAALLAGNGVATMETLSQAGAVPVKKVKKDLARAVELNMLPGAHLDEKQTCVMVGDEAYRMYTEAEKARLQREAEEDRRKRMMAEDPEAAALEHFRQEGAEALAKIKALNSAIPGEEVSRKMSQLELTASKIFAYVQKHPGKLPETRRLMSYYLPTTLKLLDKYHQYDTMEIQPANVQKAKAEIENSLDTINAAFSNLLENLYQEDTMDVSTDIEVLQTVLRQEGLAGRRFTVKAGEVPPAQLQQEEEENNG
ncbi:MAG: 5-bromo-4-chloroindolyl phosphate hydrolysis family protein [Oscillospiraceae bacterium]